MRSYVLISFTIACAVILGWAWGFISAKKGVFPYSLAEHVKNEYLLGYRFDKARRLVYDRSKVEVSCPPDDSKTGVFIALGQSNIANHAEHKFSTIYPDRVVNYFNGKCFSAASPLLGATDTKGEYLTPTMDNLVKNGVFDNIVIVSAGVGLSRISSWGKNGALYDSVIDSLGGVENRYTIDGVIWHHGETDMRNNTSTSEYFLHWNTLKELLDRTLGDPQYFLIHSTYCADNNWTKDNPISVAHRIIGELERVHPSVNTDKFLQAGSRHDHCHFAKKTQQAVADELANDIKNTLYGRTKAYPQ